MILNSCGLFVKKVNFTKEELEWFNVYNINDTLIFQCLQTQKKDTSIIEYKSLNYQYNPIIDTKRTQCMNITYVNNRYKYLEYQTKTETFMFDCKSDFRDKNQDYSGLTYLRSNFKIDNTTIIKSIETLILSKKSFNNVHELTYKRMKFHGSRDDEPELLYWDKKHGIIKYITFNGEIWERVNW